MPPRDYEQAPPPTPLARGVQLRLAYTADRGDVTRFMVQLEYWLDADWHPVVRYDHDASGSAEATHDVTSEGLHRDIYREGEKYRTIEVTPPIPADEGFTYAEDDLHENYERYITRFEQWHNIPSDNR